MRQFYLEYHGIEKLQPLVGEISWSHNLVIMSRCKDPLEREFYLRMARKFGWSKNVLIHQIENQSYEKTLLGQTGTDNGATDGCKITFFNRQEEFSGAGDMSWREKSLSDVANFCLAKMLDQNKNRGDLLPCLANVNVRWGAFDFEDHREMRFEQHELDRYGLKHGDILMSFVKWSGLRIIADESKEFTPPPFLVILGNSCGALKPPAIQPRQISVVST